MQRFENVRPVPKEVTPATAYLDERQAELASNPFERLLAMLEAEGVPYERHPSHGADFENVWFWTPGGQRVSCSYGRVVTDNGGYQSYGYPAYLECLAGAPDSEWNDVYTVTPTEALELATGVRA